MLTLKKLTLLVKIVNYQDEIEKQNLEKELKDSIYRIAHTHNKGRIEVVSVKNRNIL